VRERAGKQQGDACGRKRMPAPWRSAIFCLRISHSCNAIDGKTATAMQYITRFQSVSPIAWLPFPPGTFCDATEFSSVTLGWRELNPTRFLTVVLHLIHASLASEFG